MKLKSPYINPNHKKALEDLERYLSDIAGEPVEAVEVARKKEILGADSKYTFKFLLSEHGEVIGLKIYGFREKLTEIPEIILQFEDSLLYLNLSKNLFNNIKPLERLTKLTKLVLMSSKIGNIQSLANLINLQEICLEDNQITDISPLESLINLTNLDLGRNQISAIKPLSYIKNLEILTLGGNKIRDISSLANNTKLQVLSVADNRISDIKPLEKLTNLSWLSLAYNQISDISPLKNLTNLTTLYLSNNQISDISPLEKLINLTELWLNSNQISDISPLEKLINLTTLYLSNNQIRNISPLEKLTNLTNLDLKRNQISDLLPLAGLTNLQRLDLSDNQVSDIRPLKKLTNLYRPYLEHNQIKRLPKWIVNRKGFDTDHLYDNPLEEPPWEVVKQGREAVRKWFEQQKKYGKEVFYNAKILIVGEPEAGKTTLMNKLFDENYPVPNDMQISTLGIDVKFDLRLNHPHKDIQVNTSIWDFGGQAVQYSLHHFFLSEDALYILVSDMRGEKTRFSYWFRVINFLGGKNPRVLVVFNRRDDVTSASLYDIAQFQRDYPNIQISAIEVNLKYNDAHWQALKQAIAEQISQLSTVGQEGIKTWKQIHDHLRDLDKPYLTRSEFDQIADSYGMDSEEDIDFMLDYFHRVGWIIYYKDDVFLSDFVFLDPNWITRAIYAPLSTDNLLRNQGRFGKEWIFEFWKKQGYSRQERNMLLSLMQKEKFDICYPVGGGSQYVVPFLLPDKMPQYEWDSSNNLQLQYKYDEFMPDGILSLFIVRSYEMIEERDGHQLVWKSGVILRKDKARAEVIMRTNQQEITVRVSGGGARHLREEVFLTFDKIFRRFPKQPEVLVPCICEVCSNLETPYFYKLNELENLKPKRETDICRISGEEVSISKLLEGFELPKEIKSENQINIDKVEVYNNNFSHTQGNISFQQGGKNNTQNNPQSQNTTQGPEKEKKKKSRNWLGWIIVLLVLAVISGLFYFYFHSKPGKEDLETIMLLISAAATIVGIGGGLFKILKE